MCQFDVETTGPIRRGQPVTVRLRPPLQHPCKFEVFVNGLPATLGDLGAFRVLGIGASGTVTIQPETWEPWGTIAFKVSCPDCERTVTLALPGGTHAPDPVPIPPPPHHSNWDEHGPYDDDEGRPYIRVLGIKIYTGGRRRHRRR